MSGRQLKKEDFEEFDYIVAMDENNNIEKQIDDHKERLQSQEEVKMDYKYFQGVPDTQTLLGVLELHKHVFEGAELETEKLKEKNNLIVFVAKEDERVVGFKIGYDYGNRTFYSWLGGVHKEFRGKGIAKELMRRQHELVKSMGYTKARTISRNEKREMLVLNIKFGFDIKETFISEKGKHKIVLEKML